MEVYEEMWKSMVQRLINANQYSIRQDVTVQDIINLMAAFEEHFADELKELEDKEIKDELDLDPVD